MKKILLSLLVVITTLTACGTEKDIPEVAIENVEKMKEDLETPESIKIYYPDYSKNEILTNEVKIKHITPDELIEKMAAYSVVPNTVKVLLMEEIIEDHKYIIKLDLSKEFEEYINGLDINKENLVIGSVVNTFINAYDADGMYLTIENDPLESPNATYDLCLKEYPVSKEYNLITSDLVSNLNDVEMDMQTIDYNGYYIISNKNVSISIYDKNGNTGKIKFTTEMACNEELEKLLTEEEKKQLNDLFTKFKEIDNAQKEDDMMLDYIKEYKKLAKKYDYKHIGREPGFEYPIGVELINMDMKTIKCTGHMSMNNVFAFCVKDKNENKAYINIIKDFGACNKDLLELMTNEEKEEMKEIFISWLTANKTETEGIAINEKTKDLEKIYLEKYIKLAKKYNYTLKGYIPENELLNTSR